MTRSGIDESLAGIASDALRSGTAILQSEDSSGHAVWRLFRRPLHVVETYRVEEVIAALDEVEQSVASGLWAAGFLSYEAAPAFDSAMMTQPPVPGLPLIWFGLYDAPVLLENLPDESEGEMVALDWSPSQSFKDYARAIATIRRLIAAGHTYQVNYTIRLESLCRAHPWLLFQQLCRAQGARRCAFLRTDRHTILSLSPELFFQLTGNDIVCQPMKGTRRRGVTLDEDRHRAQHLHLSPKDRAENVMIVDMVRNDLARIADVGSVHVPRLFEVERYETVFQMISEVRAQTKLGLRAILSGLFPCASVTGAPKISTMRIIAELETAPRGVYTGSIGYVSPKREAHFNVAIRTLQLENATGEVVYGVGGGIVWDSTAEAEYDECLAKARILFEPRPRFSLLETMRWSAADGFVLLKEHLARIELSAEYFGFPLDMATVERQLDDAASRFQFAEGVVRLLVSESGEMDVQSEPLPSPPPSHPWRVALARSPIDERDRFLYHKTTHRAIYEKALSDRGNGDDVILWNTRGEITESTRANVVMRWKGRLMTPPVRCGLLPGTFRASLLAAGEIEEGVITKDDLARADALFLINSVRGWIPAVLV